MTRAAPAKRILITRPEPGASQTADRLVAMGFLPVVAPVLAITSTGSDFRLPDRLAATLVTSRNAVPACPPSCHDRPVFAVGSATAACAAEAGFSRVIDADGDAAALATLVAASLSPGDGSLFFPTARDQGFPLVKALRQHGFRVIRRVAYEATPVPVLPREAVSDLQHRQLTAALFFSTETARHFVRLVLEAGLGEAVNNVEAVSISERAAMPLRKLPWRQICVASKPNQEAILALLNE
ncbi:uroporphyrinogen-III synthase [Rhodopila globiformis]|uniref:uroporphyrinogen-III synthase n=1 Tax=Rhodopila globiformis TaxID=1071 RepID=UPI001304E9F8|nr:uroporphyrinogen-III synthase [Rhodopila globiformis]